MESPVYYLHSIIPLYSDRSTSSTITNCSCISNCGKFSLISRRNSKKSTIYYCYLGRWINIHKLSAQRLKFHIGATLPPISGKLIKRIEQGHFIEMAELLPESLGQIATDDDQPAPPKPKWRPVSDIVEWLQCFGTYIAIVSRKQPTRVIDLLGYQNLIIQAYQEYRGDRWLGYDRRFRLQVAATPSIRWAIADSTLWNIAFSGRAGVSRCSHCFSLSHQSGDCESLPSTHGEGMLYKYQPLRTSQYGERTSYNNKLPENCTTCVLQLQWKSETRL